MRANDDLPGDERSARSRALRRWGAAAGWFFLASLLLLLPSSLLPAESGLAALDKLAHFALFFWLCRSLYRSFELWASRPLAAAFLLSCSYGLAMEVLQGSMVLRSAEFGDVLANCLGAATYIGWRQMVKRSR